VDRSSGAIGTTVNHAIEELVDVIAKAPAEVSKRAGWLERLWVAAIAGVKAEGTLRRPCRHRPVQYLNNILEPDHRANKRTVKATQSFREFHAARRTIAGYQAIHMIRKGQARWVRDDDVRKQNQFIDQLFDLAACDLAAQFLSRRPRSPFQSCNTSSRP
jgi:transposase-like protein